MESKVKFDLLKQTYDQPDPVKLLINVGACLDVPTGFFIKGIHGENILNGGIGGITAVVGRGNRYKSTILHYMMLAAMDRLFSTVQTSASTYDTEINIHEEALKRFILRFPNLKDLGLIENGHWVLTDRTQYHGNKWHEKTKEYLKMKEANSKDLKCSTSFFDRVGKPLSVTLPTFTEIDSFSEFDTEEIVRMQDENEIGDSGANMMHARLGLAKQRFMMEIPPVYSKVNHFLLITAQLGDSMQIASSPYAAPPVKKLQHMGQNDKIKGVSDKFFFLMNSCWHAKSATLLMTKDKTPEYPRDSSDINSGDTDLNLVTLVQLRSKSGPSGYEISVVVSQSEGVLPEMTEFHYIKNMERFGLTGSLQSYSLDIYPDVKLSRTTVRGKLDSDVKLRRALNITSELCQLIEYKREYKALFCTPKELYEGIKEKGYDWDMILSNTRSWWCLEEDKNPLKYLSILDLLEMRVGKYKPYWL